MMAVLALDCCLSITPNVQVTFAREPSPKFRLSKLWIRSKNMCLSIISSEGKVLAMVGTKRAEQPP